MDSVLRLLIAFFSLNINRKWASRSAWKPCVDKMRILEGDIGAALNRTHIGLVLGSFHIWAFLTARGHGEGTGV